MSELFGVKLTDGSWWQDCNLDPMCGARSTVFKKLERDRAVPEFVEKLRGAQVVPVTRRVVLEDRDDRRKPRP